MPDDETIIEIMDPADFQGDPEKIIREKITPRAMQRLYESLSADSPAGVLDKAIDKAIKIDKRIREKDSIQVPNQTLVMAFNPEHLREVLGGMRGIFGQSEDLEAPRLALTEGEGVHREGMGKD